MSRLAYPLAILGLLFCSQSSFGQATVGTPTCAAALKPGTTTTWQLHGTGTVTGLPAVPCEVKVTFKFEKDVNGVWQDIFISITKTCNTASGSVAYDSGLQTISGFSPSGNYRVKVSATAKQVMGPQVPVVVAPGNSASVNIP